MNLIEHVTQTFHANIQLTTESLPSLAEPIARASEVIVQRLLEGGRAMACGNGGSAATAQHFASMMLNRFERERPGLPAMALTTDTSTLTSIASDYDFDEVFAKQIRSLAHPGDLLLAISSSGSSGSVCAAVEAAQEREMLIVALTGSTGGRLADMLRDADVEIRVPADSRPRIQELHLLTVHALCDLVDKQLLGQ